MLRSKRIGRSGLPHVHEDDKILLRVTRDDVLAELLRYFIEIHALTIYRANVDCHKDTRSEETNQAGLFCFLSLRAREEPKKPNNEIKKRLSKDIREDKEKEDHGKYAHRADLLFKTAETRRKMPRERRAQGGEPV